MSTQTEIYDGNFSIENVRDSKLKGLFKYYTGMTYVMFVTLLSFLVTPGDKAFEYESQTSDILKVDIENQLFLVLCRLRKGFQIKDLACRFNISVQCVSTLFNSWIKHMYLKLGYLSWWPSRNVIFDNMPQNYKYDFPTSMAIIDCTEIKTETPSSLKAQSQCFSDYKSSTTLKSLVCIDPRGSIMFVSSLFSGSISDNDICEKSGFLNFLKSSKERGFLMDDDAIMADKE